MAKKKSGIFKRLIKLVLFLVLLLALIVGGFALGVYLQVFDTNEINERMQLYNLPVVGEYFPVPPGAERVTAKTEETVTVDKGDKTEAKEEKKKEETKQSKTVSLTKEEIDKQTKEREAAERKRISKLARLYNEMKPQEAADAMASLDDDLTVSILQSMDEGNAAKTLAKMEPEKTARLTKLMYEGKQQKLTTPTPTPTENAQ
ncbi:MAG TPA: magnesium transporter MgtE [Selenomonas sp.]|nr:magnesium transporter MgtE [Selenomonas sp.]